MKNAHRWILRLLGVAVIGLTLTGPAPGNVRGCGQAAPIADANAFCTDRRFWACRRDQVAGRLDDAGFTACTSMIESQCSGFTFPVGCEPPQSAADACINILRDPGLLPVPSEELLATRSECMLCQ